MDNPGPAALPTAVAGIGFFAGPGEAGLVAVDRQSIRILDRAGLERRANRLA